MADVNQGVTISGEDDGGSQNVQQQESRSEAIKVAAREQGWTSRQEWLDSGKSLADWVPAKEFIGRKSLFDKIHSQKNEIFQMRKEHQKELADIKKYIATMTDVEYKRALTDLNKQRREALTTGDIDSADKIQEQIDTTKEAQKEIKEGLKQPVQQGVHPAVTEWIAKNPWFNTDQELRQVAEEQGAGIASKNQALAQNDPAKLLEMVTERVKKLYPEKFGVARKEPVNKVEGGSKTSSQSKGGTKLELSWNDLSEDQQRIGTNVVRSKILDEKAKKNGVTAKEQFLLDMQANLKRA